MYLQNRMRKKASSLRCFLSTLRQHGICPDSACRVSTKGQAGPFSTSGDFRWRESIPQQHKYAVHHRLQVRPEREPSLLQSGDVTTSCGRVECCHHHPHLHHHFARYSLRTSSFQEHMCLSSDKIQDTFSVQCRVVQEQVCRTHFLFFLFRTVDYFKMNLKLN